jgi:coenzyme F420 hydrogenase subunit beta
MKKTFFNLIQEVQKEGKCSHCGGCVTFCSAISYGALSMDSQGKPIFNDINKCNECELCYAICPQTHELDEEIKENAQWVAPLGPVIHHSVTRANDPEIRRKGTDGGVITAILTHLFNTGKIDGAIVSRHTPHGRVPYLAKTQQEILEAAGSHFGDSQGMYQFSKEYDTFSPSIKALGELKAFPMNRLAFVGTPCQINTIRKMQALGIVPSDSISLCIGLFCSGNYFFHDKLFAQLEEKYQFSYGDVEKINVKDSFIFSLKSGEQIQIPIPELRPIKRGACDFCADFSAEYADISFGGIGAEDGWTTAIIRTPRGKNVMEDSLKNVLTSFPIEDNPQFVTQAEEKIFNASSQKKELFRENQMNLKKEVRFSL